MKRIAIRKSPVLNSLCFVSIQKHSNGSVENVTSVHRVGSY